MAKGLTYIIKDRKIDLNRSLRTELFSALIRRREPGALIWSLFRVSIMAMKPFSLNQEESDLKRERAKAREMRSSQWWKRRLAKGVCHYCQQPTSPKALTMDHIVPIARGGRTTKGNIVPCCKACNNAKKQLLPMEWEAYLKSV